MTREIASMTASGAGVRFGKLADLASSRLRASSLFAGTRHADAGPSCTDIWESAVSGSWTDASKWSTGVVPSGSENACVTVAGTYTVTLTGTHAINTARRC